MTEQDGAVLDSEATEFPYSQLALRMHPRAFRALGADLVTNDIVAVIELVKNSYDAMAQNVWIRFGSDPSAGNFLEVEDDGIGMTRDVIEGVWCLVATPHKLQNPISRKGDQTRRSVGAKGLGRLSIARLGGSCVMLTQADQSPCWEVRVNWSHVWDQDDIANSFVEIREEPGSSRFRESGTSIRIHDLNQDWDDLRQKDLQENLERLLSPFKETPDFNIFVDNGALGLGEASVVRIQPPDFLSNPKYSIVGRVDPGGNVKARYKYAPVVRDGTDRAKELSITWQRIYEGIREKRFSHSSDRATCGPFSFDIRAWDIAASDTREIHERFAIERSDVRAAIRANKGISVYRDDVLVLPKSENARDWLGMDLRRVTQVGRRLSTNQVVGYVSISAAGNPKLADTSDRERLAQGLETTEFEEIIKAIVGTLESERTVDRRKTEREEPLRDLFSILSAQDLVSQVGDLASEGAGASDTVPIIREFQQRLERTKRTLEQRFVYYSRLATVGTIAQMLIHEILNRTSDIGELLELAEDLLSPESEAYGEVVTCASDAVGALEQLADRFAPLANRTFRRGTRHSCLEERIDACLDMQRVPIRERNIKTVVPASRTKVDVDPAELDTIILNLLLNSTYWLTEVPRNEREIRFELEPAVTHDRVVVWVHDSGPGVAPDYADAIFLPGVTLKPDGIGMGLTVVSELVAAYYGKTWLAEPATDQGASFGFDLPLLKR